MGMRDDLEAMERHAENGTLAEYMAGTAKPLPANERLPVDRSAQPTKNGYHWISRRGD